MAEYINRAEALRPFIIDKNGNRICETNIDNFSIEIPIKQVKQILREIPSADVVEVRHGRWLLEAHDERVNYRWNVTAECSNCCDKKTEIWAGFFPNVPDSIARCAALVSAESVKLSNYCPNCGAKMDGERRESE